MGGQWEEGTGEAGALEGGRLGGPLEAGIDSR